MRTYRVTIEGKTPLIMCHDNIEWKDRMDRWQLNPKNKAMSKAGDDRTPPFRWLGYLYHDGARVVMPPENIMRAFMDGGVRLPTGRGQKTFKAQSQSGIMAPDLYWPLIVNGQEVPVGEMLDGFEDRTWESWNDLVTKLGFMLFVKRAGVNGKKHVRVRPRFDHWSTSGTLIVLDESITPNVLMQIGDLAGQYAGLGDWRPSAPKKPGPYGMFEFRVSK